MMTETGVGLSFGMRFLAQRIKMRSEEEAFRAHDKPNFRASR